MKTIPAMYEVAAILQADGLCFAYPQRPASRLFDGLSIALSPGVTLICGDESSGKTTLLKLLAGTLPATGQLRIKGMSLAENRAAYQSQLAWLDPRDDALDQQTARQIFSALPQAHAGGEPGELQAHIEGLSLSDHLDKALYMMSTGTRRKVLLAAALAVHSTVTLLDQPFMALDRPSIDYLLGLLAQAAGHQSRAWVVADYEAPMGVALAGVIRL